ncbi:MAG: oxygen-dependent coproporphyrinogen oxidase [Acidobacteria bacterium]|nr:oxygen-dependent coproporphyrinogen oxidase [Acidobacteriota bacterium]
MSLLKDRAANFFADLQDRICKGLEACDGQAKFHEDNWKREGGGGGRTRVMTDGAIFEKAGVNFSTVFGEMPENLGKKLNLDGKTDFFATGTSLVLHPHNPMIPTTHANFRYFETKDKVWFGGGADITPYYPYREDIVHFHQTLKNACDKHNDKYYPKFKKWCDEYFTIRHRDEMRGSGGIFFDYLKDNLEETFKFVQDAGNSFLSAYVPIVEKRRNETFGERERHFQLIRRGRYVEFNLVYDRGTVFGLETKGRIESILMSLPKLAQWDYDYKPEPGSKEQVAMAYFQPQDWLGIE